MNKKAKQTKTDLTIIDYIQGAMIMFLGGVMLAICGMQFGKGLYAVLVDTICAISGASPVYTKRKGVEICNR